MRVTIVHALGFIPESGTRSTCSSDKDISRIGTRMGGTETGCGD